MSEHKHKHKSKIIIISTVVLVLILIGIWYWYATAPYEVSTPAEAQDIAKMLTVEGVKIDYIDATRHGYIIQYKAESAVDRFDDALIYDWAMIYGISAGHHCDTVTIITTLDGEAMNKQTATCPAIRALTRGVLTEQEFWTTVRHESP